MRFAPMIRALLENDMYKYSMGQVIFHQFNTYTTGWEFKCRTKGVVFTSAMVQEIKEQIKAYCELRFTDEQLKWLSNIRWMKPGYINFLSLWHPKYEEFYIDNSGECGLTITTLGSWLNTSMYETPVLAIVNEVYNRMTYDYDLLIHEFKEKLDLKVSWLERSGKYHISTFSEFGFRRRLSGEAQHMAIMRLAHADYCSSTFVGTSNTYEAMVCGVPSTGTQAHEYTMCVGQGNPKHTPEYSNHYAMRHWISEYGADNGIALTDTIGTDIFLRDFTWEFAMLFKGVRHDSGDPFIWGDKIITHYKKLGIDPKTKTLLFSDSLNFEMADRIFRYFSGRINVAFGIGTYISNDTSKPPLNIVMKPVMCNGMPVAKLSDAVGKCMCRDEEYIADLRHRIDKRLEIAA